MESRRAFSGRSVRDLSDALSCIGQAKARACDENVGIFFGEAEGAYQPPSWSVSPDNDLSANAPCSYTA